MTMPDNTATTLLAELTERGRESRTSVALRDTLLPKLISGELCVKDAVWIVESKK
jgi:hypothetical protein